VDSPGPGRTSPPGTGTRPWSTWTRRCGSTTPALAAGWQIAAATPLALAQPTIGPHLARLAAQAGDLATAHRVSAALDALAAANPAVARLQAAALARDGQGDVARELLGQAMACYEGLLARQRSAAVRARLRALGVQSGSTGRRGRPATGWRALTNSECQVVELVAEHLSNREIAQRLFVSCRTVETHVSHTLAKLGCTTRRDLSAAMRDRGRR
jgi:DNA-binding CsgD family transcriptional regulator